MVEEVNYFMKTASRPALLSPLFTSLFHFLLGSKQQLAQIAGMHDLTGMQALTLFIMSEDTAPRSMSSLVSFFNCDASNITGLVDGLEHKGLIARQENPSDRRVKLLHLLPKGIAVRDAILQTLSSDSYLLTALNPAELEQLGALMQKVVARCPALGSAGCYVAGPVEQHQPGEDHNKK